MESRGPSGRSPYHPAEPKHAAQGDGPAWPPEGRPGLGRACRSGLWGHLAGHARSPGWLLGDQDLGVVVLLHARHLCLLTSACSALGLQSPPQAAGSQCLSTLVRPVFGEVEGQAGAAQGVWVPGSVEVGQVLGLAQAVGSLTQ